MLNLVLTPLSWLYDLVTRVRNGLYNQQIIKSYQSNLAVISVGNLSIGGNAKTPLCILILELLKEMGHRPVLLSRGYGGALSGPLVVNRSHSPHDVGDEPLLLLMRSNQPVVIAKSRVAGAKYIEQYSLGDCIVLDDGLQHRALARDVDIISVNVASKQDQDEFCAAKLLPVGKFRESARLALKRATLLVFAFRQLKRENYDLDSALLAKLPPNLPIIRSYIEVVGCYSLAKKVVGTIPQSLAPKSKLVAFCAIANPTGFLQTIRDLGFEIQANFSFRDHHQFTLNDLEHIQRAGPKLPLICTEKDAVKVMQLDLSNFQIFVLSIKATVDKPQLLIDLIKQALSKKKTCQDV